SRSIRCGLPTSVRRQSITRRSDASASTPWSSGTGSGVVVVAIMASPCWRAGLGRQHNRCFTRNPPVLLGVERWSAAAAVAPIFGGPKDLPDLSWRRRQQRLGSWVKVEVAAEVDQQQSVAASVDEIAQYERLRAQYGP